MVRIHRKCCLVWACNASRSASCITRLLWLINIRGSGIAPGGTLRDFPKVSQGLLFKPPQLVGTFTLIRNPIPRGTLLFPQRTYPLLNAVYFRQNIFGVNIFFEVEQFLVAVIINTHLVLYRIQHFDHAG